ncbi:MAG: long-chain fatty acid--CoA ligase [Acidimicrobiales bacterium]
MIEHNFVDTGTGAMIGRRAKLTPKRRALTFEGTTWTYGEFIDRIDRFAAALVQGGIERGDRVGYLGLNHPNFFVAMFAANRLGATFVPINFRLTGPELAFIAQDSGIHTMVADDMHMPVLEAVRADLPCVRYIASETGGGDWEVMNDLIKTRDPISGSVRVDIDEIAVIMYTSGTTGQPKGAMLTHGNLCWNNINALHAIDLGTDEVALVVAPLFHIGGLNVTTLICWQKGGEVVLHRAFDPGAALEAIAEHGITNMFGVPAMFLFMSQHPKFDETDFTSARVFVVGGAPVPEPLTKIYLGKGVPFAQGYGLTETSPMCSFLLPEYALEKVGSAGFAGMYTAVEVFDEDGNMVPTGSRGEICIKGPNVMKGYWNRPDATAEAIDANGWFHSGDLGYLDEDGFLFVVDRLKDMVISGGENVYPAEVESVLYEHPSVAEVAIIGMPDERWGEAVTAVVACAEGTDISLEDLREFGGASLAKFKLPIRLHTVDALPRNPAGKVLKFELRDRFAG